MKIKSDNFIVSVFAALYFLLSVGVNGQDCVNGISTYPVNPVSTYPFSSGTNNLWLNTFDVGANNGSSFEEIELNPNAGWLVPDYTNSGFTMKNPFTTGATPNSPYLSSPYSPFINRDFHWEDGWELLWLGTGYYPNNEQPYNVTPQDAIITSPSGLNDKRIPYIVMYNRYRGVVRVFAGLFAPFGSFQDVSIDLALNSSLAAEGDTSISYNGLLRHLNNYDSPLDQFTNQRAQRGVNNLIGSNGTFNTSKWYSYDFQVGYDPCTCSDMSVVDINFSATQSSNVSLYGRMISVEEPLTDANGKPTYDRDFLTATSINNQDPNGYVLKSSLDSLIGDYQKNLNTYNQQMEDREFGKIGWIGDMLNKSKKVIVGSATDLIPGGNIANWFIEKKLCTAWKWNIDVDTASIDTSKVKKFITNSSKGALGLGFDFLSSEFFGEKPVRPSRPVATFSEMRFSGEIQTSNSSKLSGFITPGSQMDGIEITAHNYPAYNEVLGLYATLRTPQVQYWSTQSPVLETHNSVVEVDSSDFDDSFIPDYTRIDSTVYKSKTIHQEIYLKLKDPIQYALNKALDFDTTNTQVNVSFQIVLENAQTFPNTYTNRIDSTANAFSDSTNLWTLHDIAQNNTPQHGSRRKVELVSGWSNIQDAANLLHGSLFSTTIYYSELYEKDYTEGGENWWNPFQNEFNEEVPIITEQTIKYRPVEITMKIMADMFFNQTGYIGEKINTTQIFTYLIYDEAKGIDLIGDQGNYLTDSAANNLLNGFIQMYPGILTIQSEVISVGSPEVIWPNNELDMFLIRAEQIKIDKSLEGSGGIPSGPLVKIVAHDNIRLLPGAHVKPKIVLRIEKGIYGIPEAHPATENEISQFCGSNNYNAGTFVPAMGRQPINSSVSHAELNNSPPNSILNTVQIHPNPANSHIWISSTSTSISEVQIMDISGRVLIHENPGDIDVNKILVNISSLQTGIYIVQTKCGNEHNSQKLVVGK